MGPDVVGVKTVARYHFSYDTPANKRFVEAYRKKFNEWPNAYAGHAYDGLMWFFDVVEKSGSWDVEKWVADFEKELVSQFCVWANPDARLRPSSARRGPLGRGCERRCPLP